MEEIPRAHESAKESDLSWLPDRRSSLDEFLLSQKITKEYLEDVLRRDAFWNAVTKSHFSVEKRVSPENVVEFIEIRDRDGNIYFSQDFRGLRNALKREAN